MPVRILAVCTGNICRSPLTERLLVVRLAQALGGRADEVQVESAGTRAMVGSPMAGPAAAQLHLLGGSSDGFVSRQLTARMLEGADLVVTATRAHRAAAVSLSPQALLRTFTLRELGRLLDGVPADAVAEGAGGSTDLGERVRSLAAVARGRRGWSQPEAADGDDVLDPYLQSDAVYARATEQIVGPVEAVVAALCG